MLLTRIHMLSAFLCGRTSKQHIHYSYVWEGAGRLAASPLHASACQGTVNVIVLGSNATCAPSKSRGMMPSLPTTALPVGAPRCRSRSCPGLLKLGRHAKKAALGEAVSVSVSR